MYHLFFTHSSVNRNLGCFYVLAIVNIDAVKVGMYVSLQIKLFSAYTPRSGVAESYGSSMVSLRNRHTVLHSG